MTGSSCPEPAHHRFCQPRVIAGLALAGVVLVLFGAWNAAGQPVWSPSHPYDHTLDQAIAAQVGETVAIVSACVGAAFILLAAALFGYWLVRSSYQRRRGAD